MQHHIVTENANEFVTSIPLQRLVGNMRAEQEFQDSLRELFGLDEAASRTQILHVATVLFGELGFLTGNVTSPRDSRARS